MRPAHEQKEKAVGVERTHGVKSVLKKDYQRSDALQTPNVQVRLQGTGVTSYQYYSQYSRET